MQVATRFIIAKLRNRQFSSLAALNAAIAELEINNRVSRHLGASRRALFEELERSALKPLPAESYVFAEWKECRVGLDYHVEIEKHYYSVPHQLLREKVWARITARTVEIFHRGKRVAAHVRSSSNRKHTTVREHMLSSHPRYANWTPERLRRQASEIGCHTSALIEIILRERAHPEQGFRACAGILRLAKTRPVGSTRRCPSSWPPAAGSPTTAILWSPVRAVSASRGYPVHSRRKPAATATRSLRLCAALVCRSRSRPRRRSLRAAVPDAGQDRSPRAR